VTTQNGIKIESLTKGTTNHAINIAGTGAANDIIFGGDTSIHRSATRTLTINATTNTNNITIYGLTGAGNAYACLNENGTLYRSETACT